MRHALRLHPDSHCKEGTRVDAELAVSRPGHLIVRYIVTGVLDELRIPALAASTRTDGLWRHTCFELFVRPLPGAAYYELNLSPSTQWAAYRFSGYRDGMQVAEDIPAPRIETQSGGGDFTLQATAELAGLPRAADWRLGLSAVIEETSGRLSYWALAHPPGKPDFHHSDCFALTLAQASRS